MRLASYIAVHEMAPRRCLCRCTHIDACLSDVRFRGVISSPVCDIPVYSLSFCRPHYAIGRVRQSVSIRYLFRGVQLMLSMAQDAPWIKWGETKKPKDGGGNLNLIYRYKFRFIMFLPVGVSEKSVAKRCYISAGMSDVDPLCLSVWPYLKTHTRKLHETFRRLLTATVTSMQHVLYTGWAIKTGLFFRLDNFVTVSPRKACSMSKFSQFYREKGTKLAFQ